MWLFLLILAACIAYLAFQQSRLQRIDAELQSEKERLTEARVRAEQLQAALTAKEQQIADMTTELQEAQNNLEQHTPTTAFPRATSPTAQEFVPTLTEPRILPASEDPGPVSSSHAPTGELLHRSWGPEQVIGPPDTEGAGDLPTAWAPRLHTGVGEEWLRVNYERPVDIAEINVRETYNPGAISKITAVLPNGQEVTVWEGVETAAEAPVDRTLSFSSTVHANSIKIYLDRRRVAGWNEIDAVELVGRDGSHQWACSANASSSYAEQPGRDSNLLRATEATVRTL
jgi:hypothetical protein